MTPIEPIFTDETMGEDDGMRASYDFSNGVRGSHAARYAQGVKVRVVDQAGNVVEKNTRAAEEEIVEMAFERPKE
jgi:hypothetical protein